MKFTQTAEWWEACAPDGRQHKELSSGELSRVYGGTDRMWRKRKKRAGVPPANQRASAPSGRESLDIFADGSRASEKLIEMSDAQSKDTAYLLDAHGFGDEWEVVSARSSVWQSGERTLYASKLHVRPRSGSLSVADIIAAACGVAPVRVKAPRSGAGMLEANCSDMHLGNSTLSWYADTLARTVALIRSKPWAEVVLPIGSDLFHCDNFHNTTSNGTLQSSVAWPEAWADATAFYSTLIEAALENARAVHCYYIIGNHDESMSWAFCHLLAAKYPQVRFDLGIDERKVHGFGDVAVGMTHGDGRTRKDLDRIFMAEFPAFASAKVREVHAGHYHHELTRDEYGVVVRSLSTAARTDKWHREEGYVGACKRFACFEYATDALTAIHYV